MGSVYRARDLHFPNVVKLVAVKEMINLAPDPLVRQTIVQNFEREANLLATLNHPSIPRIYDYFTEDNRSYLVLEFVHGKDLEAVINDSNGFLPEDQVISWAIQLCDVLAYLHAHKPDPIIFRDMKPSNIMINHNGDVILVDFGIAKTFQSGVKGTMIGTEGYSLRSNTAARPHRQQISILWGQHCITPSRGGTHAWSRPSPFLSAPSGASIRTFQWNSKRWLIRLCSTILPSVSPPQQI